MSTSCGIYAKEEEAKRSVTSRATFNNMNIVMEESEILGDIQAKALRNIIAAPDLETAKKIARDVMADPAKWLKELEAPFKGTPSIEDGDECPYCGNGTVEIVEDEIRCRGECGSVWENVNWKAGSK